MLEAGAATLKVQDEASPEEAEGSGDLTCSMYPLLRSSTCLVVA